MSILKLVTYNTHLFGGSHTDLVERYAPQLLKGRIITFEDDVRARNIAEKIRVCGADVVALQEVWGTDRQAYFANELKAVYPNSCMAPVPGIWDVTSVDAFWDYLRNSCGLVLLSKYRLKDAEYVRFTDVTDAEDAYAKKGVLAVTVCLPEADLRLCTSHAGTDMGGTDQQPNIRQIAQSRRLLDAGAVMMGDFNVHKRFRDKMDAIFASPLGGGARDACVQAHKDEREMTGAATIDMSTNQLDQIFSLTDAQRAAHQWNPADEGQTDRIDYVYIRDGLRETLQPTYAAVLRDWTYVSSDPKVNRDGNGNRTIDLSDHFPLRVDLMITTRAAFPIWTRKTSYTNVNASARPSLVEFNNTLHMYQRRNDGSQIIEHWRSADGSTWDKDNPFDIGITSSAGPTAIVDGKTVRIFFRSGNGANIYEMVSEGSSRFERKKPDWDTGMLADHEVSAALLQGGLCLVGLEHNGSRIIRAYRGAGQNAFSVASTGFRSGSPPSIVAYQGRFHVFYQDLDGTGIMHIVSTDGLNWSESPTRYTGYTTSAGPSAIAFEDRIHVFFRDGAPVQGAVLGFDIQGYKDGVLHVSSGDGTQFVPTGYMQCPSWYIGMNARVAPSLAAFKGALHVLGLDPGGAAVNQTIFKLRN